jgi:hypothetical protein
VCLDEEKGSIEMVQKSKIAKSTKNWVEGGPLGSQNFQYLKSLILKENRPIPYERVLRILMFCQ